MNYWIFKVSNQSTYPDLPGRCYVYDNTHSVRVAGGDEFIYLEKAGARYGLTGAGRVFRVTRRRAKQDERHNARVNSVITAHLDNVVWFSKPFDLSMQNKTGRRNRQAVGLPEDLNSIGWSISMPRIESKLFVRLLDAALEAGPRKEIQWDDKDEPNWRVDDSWSLVRRRLRMQAFRRAVLVRHKHTCVVCGTRLRSVLNAAHIRRYAADSDQRANPANGICLCSFCHAAYDSGEVSIMPDGSLQFSLDLDDEIALMHFTVVPKDKRQDWLRGVDRQFLLERVGAKNKR